MVQIACDSWQQIAVPSAILFLAIPTSHSDAFHLKALTHPLSALVIRVVLMFCGKPFETGRIHK
jgi:hypothetical protein